MSLRDPRSFREKSERRTTSILKLTVLACGRCLHTWLDNQIQLIVSLQVSRNVKMYDTNMNVSLSRASKKTSSSVSSSLLSAGSVESNELSAVVLLRDRLLISDDVSDEFSEGGRASYSKINVSVEALLVFLPSSRSLGFMNDTPESRETMRSNYAICNLTVRWHELCVCLFSSVRQRGLIQLKSLLVLDLIWRSSKLHFLVRLRTIDKHWKSLCFGETEMEKHRNEFMSQKHLYTLEILWMQWYHSW